MSSRANRISLLAALLALAVVITGCGQKNGTQTSRSGSIIRIEGAGATFPYPVYSSWASEYYELSGVQVNYQSIGSGGGIQQIKAETVDFGATDAPLTADELKEAGLMQFPMIMGGVVPVINVEGIDKGRLKLSPTVLAGIFLGKIKKWNAPAIKKDNPDLKLPNKDIAVVHRADGAGTTWIFTNYLAKISPTWKRTVGADKSVSWPTGSGGKGNEGVSAYVKRIDGSIGYVEYAFAIQADMNFVRLKNKAGRFVKPSIETFQAAAANADWRSAPGFYMMLIDQSGEQSWPITGTSYIILRKEQKDPKLARSMLEFFDWCYQHGSDTAKKLDFVPMPESVYELVKERWSQEIKADGKPVWQQE